MCQQKQNIVILYSILFLTFYFNILYLGQMGDFLDDHNMLHNIVNIQSVYMYLSSVLVQFYVALPVLNESTTKSLLEASTNLNMLETFDGFSIISQNISV